MRWQEKLNPILFIEVFTVFYFVFCYLVHWDFLYYFPDSGMQAVSVVFV
jgi:hypothetical protein